MKIKKALAAGSAAVVAASALAVTASAANEAYIGYVTSAYSFRNEYNEGNYGKTGAYPDCFDGITVWTKDGVAEENYATCWGEEYEDYYEEDFKGFLMPATYTDTQITGDGTYSVKAETDYFGLKPTNDFVRMFVSTETPYVEGCEITDYKILVDGADVGLTNPAAVSADANGNIYIEFVNEWNAEVGPYGAKGFPTKSLEYQFTIKGLSGSSDSAVDAATDNAAPAAGDTSAPTAGGSKDSPDTGVEDVAVIGGLAILAGAAIALTRKRK